VVPCSEYAVRVVAIGKIEPLSLGTVENERILEFGTRPGTPVYFCDKISSIPGIHCDSFGRDLFILTVFVPGFSIQFVVPRRSIVVRPELSDRFEQSRIAIEICRVRWKMLAPPKNGSVILIVATADEEVQVSGERGWRH